MICKVRTTRYGERREWWNSGLNINTRNDLRRRYSGSIIRDMCAWVNQHRHMYNSDGDARIKKLSDRYYDIFYDRGNLSNSSSYGDSRSTTGTSCTRIAAAGLEGHNLRKDNRCSTDTDGRPVDIETQIDNKTFSEQCRNSNPTDSRHRLSTSSLPLSPSSFTASLCSPSSTENMSTRLSDYECELMRGKWYRISSNKPILYFIQKECGIPVVYLRDNRILERLILFLSSGQSELLHQVRLCLSGLFRLDNRQDDVLLPTVHSECLGKHLYVQHVHRDYKSMLIWSNTSQNSFPTLISSSHPSQNFTAMSDQEGSNDLSPIGLTLSCVESYGPIIRAFRIFMMTYFHWQLNIYRNIKHLADLRSPESLYPVARNMVRSIHVHHGCTNSGKTFNALSKLIDSRKGVYCAPLRMLCWENASHLSCTVEMLPLNVDYDVAVIDEMQMMGDPTRGHAFTRAFMALQAKEIHLCGSSRFVKLISSLANYTTNDQIFIHEYTRLSRLTLQTKPLSSVNDLNDGDCLIVFSRKDILKYRYLLTSSNSDFIVSVVYGSLPPQTRRHQTDIFNARDNNTNDGYNNSSDYRNNDSKKKNVGDSIRIDNLDIGTTSRLDSVCSGAARTAAPIHNIGGINDIGVIPIGNNSKNSSNGISCSNAATTGNDENSSTIPNSANHTTSGNDPSNSSKHILIASDCIGMGLNLRINRVVFTTLQKYDGKAVRYLYPHEITQIAGRAGRYMGTRQSGEGFVTSMNEDDMPRLAEALNSDTINADTRKANKNSHCDTKAHTDNVDDICKAGWFPTFNQFEVFSAQMETEAKKLIPFHILLQKYVEMIDLDETTYFLSSVDSMVKIASLIADINLTRYHKFTFATAPVSADALPVLTALRTFAQYMSGYSIVPLPDEYNPNMLSMEVPTTARGLEYLENLYEILEAYIWLANQFNETPKSIVHPFSKYKPPPKFGRSQYGIAGDVYTDVEKAKEGKEILIKYINDSLQCISIIHPEDEKLEPVETFYTNNIDFGRRVEAANGEKIY